MMFLTSFVEFFDSVKINFYNIKRMKEGKACLFKRKNWNSKENIFKKNKFERYSRYDRFNKKWNQKITKRLKQELFIKIIRNDDFF